MSVRFDAYRGPVIVPVRVWGRGGSGILRFVLDTGATDSLISEAPLVTLGYEPASISDQVEVTTGSGVLLAPQVVVERIRAVDNEIADFPILCHTLPATAGVDGLLGLDFLRGHSLLVDFCKGEITLS
jgi:predicted aspartyl protease